MSRRAEQYKAVVPCICRKRTCAECSARWTRTCSHCLRRFVFQAGKPYPVSRCSANCAPHNQTLDLLEARLADVERRFADYLANNVHIATVMPQPFDDAVVDVVDDELLEALATAETQLFEWE